MKPSSFFSLLVAALVLLFAAGCKDNASAPVSADNLASEDAANVIAGDIGAQSGGANDMLTDIADLRSPLFASAEGGGLGVFDRGTGRYGTYTRTYDPSAQTWTVVIEASHQNPRVSGSWRREYKYWFSKNDVRQQFFITNGVMADKVNFEIIESGCSGQFTSPRVSHQLIALRGSVVATVSVSGNDTLLTINSVQPRYRAGIDSIRIRGGLRTSNHDLTMTFNDVVVPTSLERRLPEEIFAGRRFRNVRPISGTITGTYNALITFQRGDQYDERQVTRNFTIDFASGSGEFVNLDVTGPRATRFRARINLQTGELN